MNKNNIKRKIVVYSHDTFGLGNIRRMLVIAQSLVESDPNTSVLILSGSPMLHAFRIPPQIDYIKLPCLKGIAYFAIANEPEVTRKKIDNILINNFNFNEETYQFKDQVDWLNNPSIDIEWAIMLHKFYYAVGQGIAFKETGDRRYAEIWIGLTSSWITTVPVDFLSSDVTGRRIQNWVFALRKLSRLNFTCNF
jgi:Heparinase II/III N-terminus